MMGYAPLPPREKLFFLSQIPDAARRRQTFSRDGPSSSSARFFRVKQAFLPPPSKIERLLFFRCPATRQFPLRSSQPPNSPFVSFAMEPSSFSRVAMPLLLFLVARSEQDSPSVFFPPQVRRNSLSSSADVPLIRRVPAFPFLGKRNFPFLLFFQRGPLLSA